MKSFIAYIYELMVPLPQSSKWWGRRCQFVAGFLLVLYWAWFFVVIVPDAFHLIFGRTSFDILSLSVGLVILTAIFCYALFTFMVFCGVPKDSSKYIFEYRTPPSQSNWAQSWRILSSFLVVVITVLSSFLAVTEWSNFLSRTELYIFLNLALLSAPTLLIVILVFCGHVHLPHLVVLVSHNDVLLHRVALVKFGHWWSRDAWRAYRRRIPMCQIKSIHLTRHTKNDFRRLFTENNFRPLFTENELRSLLMPLIFMDFSSYDSLLHLHNGTVHTADLELNDGIRISVCFKGVEKFVEEVNRVLVLN